MTYSHDVKRPSWRKLLAEAPAGLRLILAQLQKAPETGRAASERTIIVVPAYLGHDVLTSALRRTLTARGHRVFGWSQGINSGARRQKFDGLLSRIDDLASFHHEKLTLIGWSLGGLYAREAAKRRPNKVQAVITLGTPISYGLRDNNAWKLYEALNDHDVDHPPVEVDPSGKPPMRTVAIWSAKDGIVAPASASAQPGAADQHVHVGCSHNELVSHPDALDAVIAAVESLAGDDGGNVALPTHYTSETRQEQHDMAANNRKESRRVSPRTDRANKSGRQFTTAMSSVRENAFIRAAAVGGAVAAGVFLWSRRNQIGDQVGNVVEQITHWRNGEEAEAPAPSDNGTVESFIAGPESSTNSTGRSQVDIAHEALTLKELGTSA